MVYSVWKKKMAASPWLHNRISDFLCAFIKYQIVYCFSNYYVEILPILT
jgi:hypothetical protein